MNGQGDLVDSDELASVASALSSLFTSLEELAGTLGGVGARAVSIDYQVRSAAPTLGGLLIAALRHGDVGSAIASYAGALRAYGRYSDHLAREVRRSAETFDECERKLCGEFLRQDAVYAQFSAALKAEAPGEREQLAQRFLDGGFDGLLVGLGALAGVDCLQDAVAT